MRLKPVIMAGGCGSRLWPLSSSNKPKQFRKILGEVSLLQQTLIRNKNLGKPLVIIAEKYKLISQEQAAEINIDIDLVCEPSQKNTAICAVVTALIAKKQGFDTVILLPSDHHISNEEVYLITIDLALQYVEKWGICTIGVPIKAPNQEYGYIKTGSHIAKNVYQTERFIEKPSEEQAQDYIQNGKYFWNSGIYLYKIDFLLEQVARFQPDLLLIAKEALSKPPENEISTSLNNKAYDVAENISLDHALIEHISQLIMVEAKFDWCDLGTWDSVLQIKSKNLTNNYCEGNVIISDTTNSYISSYNKLTTIIGLDNIIIVNTANNLLVANRSKTNELKQIMAKLKNERLGELL